MKSVMNVFFCRNGLARSVVSQLIAAVFFPTFFFFSFNKADPSCRLFFSIEYLECAALVLAIIILFIDTLFIGFLVFAMTRPAKCYFNWEAQTSNKARAFVLAVTDLTCLLGSLLVLSSPIRCYE